MSEKSYILHDGLQSYIQSHMSPEHPLLTQLHDATKQLSNAKQQSAPESVKFLQLLIQLIQAKRVLEIGVFTGYATLAMALVLPDDGELVACERNDEALAIGKPIWQQANVADKITLKLGDAVEMIQALIDTGHTECFDFCFIDANKSAYKKYYELCLQLTRKNGLIVIDNTLWSGDVAREQDQSRLTRKLRELNEHIANDTRVEAVIMPMADGITLARKV